MLRRCETSGLSKWRWCAVLLFAGAVLSSCNQEETYSSAPSGDTPCQVTDAQIRQWIESPSVPSDPTGTEEACFWNFAWQEFFAMTKNQGNVPLFATWPNDQELFPSSGDPKPWQPGSRRMRTRMLRKGLGLPGAGGVTADQVKEAAALTPITDQRGRWAHFSVVVDQKEYEYVRCCELYRGGCFNTMGGVAQNPPTTSQISLPNGSLELKLAWRVLETCDLPDSPPQCQKEDPSRYLTVEGDVQPYSPAISDQPVKATLGLVGMHIVQKTPQHSGAVWATFEHVDNAPDCPLIGGQKPTPPPGFPGWQFYNSGCQDPQGYGACLNNSYCPPCPIGVPKNVADAFNADSSHSWKIPQDPQTGVGTITCTPNPTEFNKPVMVDGQEVWIYLFDPESCQRNPIPTQTCRSTSISPEVAALNDQVQKVLGQIGGSSAALANYELVRVMWSNGPKDAQPAGNTVLANTTLETYLQTLPTGCLTCHSDGVEPVPSQAPMAFNSALADRSMVFQQIRQFGVSCSEEQANKCPNWTQGCPVEQ